MDWFRSQEKDKDLLYMERFRLRGYSFAPFVVTPWGGLGPEARKVMFRLHQLALGSKRGWARTHLSQAFWHKFSLAVARSVGRQLSAILEVTEPAWEAGPLMHHPYGGETMCVEGA